MKKGDILFKVLEAIGNLTITSLDLLDVFLSAGYGASYGKLEYELSRKQNERERKSLERERQKKVKQKYYNLIYKLGKNGLLKEKIKKDKKFFVLTKKGRDKLLWLKKREKENLPEISYSKQENNKFVIIIFDIPETEKRKREWLRGALRSLGFKMIQKSVWAGKVKVPKEFLDDLFKLKLIDFVQIFEISKTGSLEDVI